tara:strand:- start:2126 stop:3532 length:1407 start_codon:yes stop_codon:yes gene_type:complete
MLSDINNSENLDLEDFIISGGNNGNAQRCKRYYNQNCQDIQKARVLKRLYEGKMVRANTIKKYDLETEAQKIKNGEMAYDENKLFLENLINRINNTDLSPLTKAGHISKLNQINKFIPPNKLFLDFITNFDEFVTVLKTRYSELNFSPYLHPLIVVSRDEDSPTRQWYLQNKAKINEIIKTARIEKLDAQEAAAANIPALSWNRIEDFIAFINQPDDKPSPAGSKYLAKPKWGGQEHLLFNLMFVNTIRDDYGNIKLFKSSNDNTIKESLILPHNAGIVGGYKPNLNIELPDDTNNWLDLATMTLFLQDYKSKKTYGKITRVMPSNIVKLIIASLKAEPRKHLIEFKNSQGHITKLSAIIPKLFRQYLGVEISINDLRHSKIAHYHSMPISDFKRGSHKEALAAQMLHSLETAIMIYHRINIYDLNIETIKTAIDTNNENKQIPELLELSEQLLKPEPSKQLINSLPV